MTHAELAWDLYRTNIILSAICCLLVDNFPERGLKVS